MVRPTAPFFFPAMRGEGPSGNNLKSINSSPLKSPGFKRVVWVFRMLVMELLSSLSDLAASSLWERAGVKDVNLLQCPFCLYLPDWADKDAQITTKADICFYSMFIFDILC